MSVAAPEPTASSRNPVGAEEAVASAERRARFLAVGGILAALGAASCCVVPFGLFLLGVSGAWIGNLTALEPYQPIFAGLALGAIGYGFYLVRRRAQVACEDGSYCASPNASRLAKTGLWAATVLVAVAVAFPRLAPLFL